MKYGHFNKFGWGVTWNNYDDILYQDLCYISQCMNAEEKYLDMQQRKITHASKEYA